MKVIKIAATILLIVIIIGSIPDKYFNLMLVMGLIALFMFFVFSTK